MKGSHKDWIMKGYRYVYKPDHPSSHKGGLLDGRILEHRMIAEDMIGRPLEKTESVHHEDRNRLNNSPSNLVILNEKAHSLLHKLEEIGVTPVMDSIQFAHDGESIQIVDSRKKETHNPQLQRILDSIQQRCIDCGKPLANTVTSLKSKTGLCQECFKKHNSAHIPDKVTFTEILRNRSMEEVGREFGVSGKTIRKWADKRGIDIHGLTKPVGFTTDAKEKAFSEEARKKKGEAVKKHWRDHVHPSSKPVVQLDETGSVIARFNSAVDASRSFGHTDGSPVVRACRDSSKTYKGFHWEYAS